VSFCAYTNDDGESIQPQTWKLERNCSKTDYKKISYEAREESDPFFTDTDMIWGMSGSLLFDTRGLLLGIGSNMLGTSGDCDPKKQAVYVKSANLLRLLNALDHRNTPDNVRLPNN
jgi:hypothetical protein